MSSFSQNPFSLPVVGWVFGKSRAVSFWLILRNDAKARAGSGSMEPASFGKGMVHLYLRFILLYIKNFFWSAQLSALTLEESFKKPSKSQERKNYRLLPFLF